MIISGEYESQKWVLSDEVRARVTINVAIDEEAFEQDAAQKLGCTSEQYLQAMRVAVTSRFGYSLRTLQGDAHRWTAKICNRANGIGCPCCSGRVPSPGKNDLATLEPELVKEWDYENNEGKTPDQFAKRSNEAVNWICKECGHRWCAKIYARTRGSGCPCCAGKVVVPGKNDFATLEPELVKEWDHDNNDGKTPDQFARNSHEEINWICRKCGHRWPARIIARTNGRSCPGCRGRKEMQRKVVG